jgi:hypothetical protein
MASTGCAERNLKSFAPGSGQVALFSPGSDGTADFGTRYNPLTGALVVTARAYSVVLTSSRCDHACCKAGCHTAGCVLVFQRQQHARMLGVFLARKLRVTHKHHMPPARPSHHTRSCTHTILQAACCASRRAAPPRRTRRSCPARRTSRRRHSASSASTRCPRARRRSATETGTHNGARWLPRTWSGTEQDLCMALEQQFVEATMHMP